MSGLTKQRLLQDYQCEIDALKEMKSSGIIEVDALTWIREDKLNGPKMIPIDEAIELCQTESNALALTPDHELDLEKFNY